MNLHGKELFRFCFVLFFFLKFEILVAFSVNNEDVNCLFSMQLHQLPGFEDEPIHASVTEILQFLHSF